MKKKKNNNSKGCLAILAIFFVFIFIFVVGLYAIFHHYIDKTNYVEIDPSASIEINEDYTEETVAGTNSPDNIIQDIENELLENISGESDEGTNETQNSITDVLGVEHILLIGSDRRSQNWNGNSDSMILISINNNTNKIIMTSLMRDSYVYIPEVGNARLNVAYAKGVYFDVSDPRARYLSSTVTMF